MSEEKKLVSGTMFHTNYSKLTRKYRCDDDCLPSGCPSHTITLEIFSTSGTACLHREDEADIYFDCNEAEAIYEMFKDLH